eukprot:gene7705-biopygen4577
MQTRGGIRLPASMRYQTPRVRDAFEPLFRAQVHCMLAGLSATNAAAPRRMSGRHRARVWCEVSAYTNILYRAFEERVDHFTYHITGTRDPLQRVAGTKFLILKELQRTHCTAKAHPEADFEPNCIFWRRWEDRSAIC